MLVRVFEMPDRFSSDYCFSPNPQTFLMVDWFRDDACPDDDELRKFIETKRYFSPSKSFLVLRETGTFTIGYRAP